jgi:hypothetical protein
MRLAGVLILAIMASALLGSLAYAAVSFLPDWDDPAGRGLDAAFRAALTLAYVVLCIILYGFAVWRSDSARRLKRALYVLLLVPFLVVVLGVINNGARNINSLRESIGMLQMCVPLWIVALAQWFILHIYLARRSMGANAAST